MSQETLTQADLTITLAKVLNIPRLEIKPILTSILSLMNDSIINDKKLKLTNFGTFNVRDKNTRMGRNPKTGERAIISARKIIIFAPATYLRNKIADRQE